MPRARLDDRMELRLDYGGRLGGLAFLGQQRKGSENQCEQGQPEPRAEDAVHCFCSLLGEVLEVAAGVFSPGAVVWAPWATSSFLITSDVPTGIVKIAPCRPPSASRY